MISKHSTIPIPDSLYRRLEKLVLPSIFDTSLSSLMMWNMQSYPTTVLNERMWHFGGQTYSDAPTYFQGPRPPNPQDIRPLFRVTSAVAWCFRRPEAEAMKCVPSRSRDVGVTPTLRFSVKGKFPSCHFADKAKLRQPQSTSNRKRYRAFNRKKFIND